MIAEEKRRRCDICGRAGRRMFQADVRITYREYPPKQLLLEPQPEETVVVEAKLDLDMQHLDRLIHAANRGTKSPGKVGV